MKSVTVWIIIWLLVGCTARTEVIQDPANIPVYPQSTLLDTHDDPQSTGRILRTIILHTADTEAQVFEWYRQRMRTTNLKETQYAKKYPTLYFRDTGSCPEYDMTVMMKGDTIIITFLPEDCM